MRTDRFADPKGSAHGSLSRRAFVLAGGSAAGTVVGGGLASAADGRDDHRWVVGATAPYLAAVREATSAVDVVASRHSDRGDPPDLLVSGRPESTRETHQLSDVLVDGRATLSNPDDTWRDALRPATVEERWSADPPVEAWSEVAGDAHSVVGSVERPDATDEVTTLVRGTRAYQYAEGRGGVGYYDVDGSAVAATGQGAASGGEAAVPIVRLAYVHTRQNTKSDDRLADFLEEYGDSAAGTGDDEVAYVDPDVEV